jgi:hypothetical protein
MPALDPYVVLGLPTFATRAQIRTRYSQLLAVYRRTGSATNFGSIRDAYKLLIDPVRRRAYDDIRQEMEQRVQNATAVARKANEEPEGFPTERTNQEEGRKDRARATEERRQHKRERQHRDEKERKARNQCLEEERDQTRRATANTCYGTYNRDPPPPYMLRYTPNESTPLFPKSPQRPTSYGSGESDLLDILDHIRPIIFTFGIIAGLLCGFGFFIVWMTEGIHLPIAPKPYERNIAVIGTYCSSSLSEVTVV